MFGNEETTISIFENKNKQVELTFDFVKQMKKEVKKIKKQRKNLSISIEKNEYLTALREIYKKSYNKYGDGEPLVGYFSKKDENKNNIFVIGSINQDGSGVDYYLNDNFYTEKIKKDLQNIMKAIEKLSEETKQHYVFEKK